MECILVTAVFNGAASGRFAETVPGEPALRVLSCAAACEAEAVDRGPAAGSAGGGYDAQRPHTFTGADSRPGADRQTLCCRDTVMK